MIASFSHDEISSDLGKDLDTDMKALLTENDYIHFKLDFRSSKQFFLLGYIEYKEKFIKYLLIFERFSLEYTCLRN